MNPPLPRRVSISGDTLCQHVDGQAVLLHLTAERYHSLDAVGTSIWDALSEDGDVERMIQQMLSDWDVDESLLRSDAAVLLRALADAELITIDE